MNYVLDACAMLAYLKGEPGALVVDSLLRDSANVCYAHAINLCEVYYDFLRYAEERIAQEAISDLYADGVIERQDMVAAFGRPSDSIKRAGGFRSQTVFVSPWRNTSGARLSPLTIASLIPSYRSACAR
ncbi:MAG TPA: hypothetical protein VKA60_07475 [Blastocatellia bacterium]|nr:hypothetical protein [Blastocatellia bacterium]